MKKNHVWVGAYCIVFIWLVFLLAAIHAKAHEAHSQTWVYPPECCGEQDCGVATKVEHQDDGSLIITTKIGTAHFPTNIPPRSSKDEAVHACMSIFPVKEVEQKDGSKRKLHQGYCLFVPAGS